MDHSHHCLLGAEEDSTRQRLPLREFRFVPEDSKLSSSTDRTEARRFLKTSQAPRSRPQLLAPVKATVTPSSRSDGPLSDQTQTQQRLSVVPLDGVGVSAKCAQLKPMRKAPHVRGAAQGKRVSPLRGSSYPRFVRRATSLDQGRRKDLQIEGNSVLSTSPSFALQALEHLSECVQEERRLRMQLDAAQTAKVNAFRSVIKVFLTACTDTQRGASDGITIARCSVVTNALVVIIQSYLRAVKASLCAQSQFAAARLSGRLIRAGSLSRILQSSPSTTDDELHQGNAFEQSLSTTRNLEDLLDMNEINQLKQLYFDFYDCEAVSLGSDKDSEFDGGSAQPHPPDFTSSSLTSTETTEL